MWKTRSRVKNYALLVISDTTASCGSPVVRQQLMVNNGYVPLNTCCLNLFIG